MSTGQGAEPCRAKTSIADEFGRAGTSRSKVGCDAIDEPWTNRIVALVLAGSTACLFHRNSFTSPLLVQCSVPGRRLVISFMNGPFVRVLGGEWGGKPDGCRGSFGRLIQGRRRPTYPVF